MNKLSNKAPMGTLLIDEKTYKRQFNTAKKKLEREVYREYFVNTDRREAATMIKGGKRFLSHPHRLPSDTDSSSTSSSSTKLNSPSNVMDSKQSLECLYQSKLADRKLTRCRRQSSNLTQLKGRSCQGVLEEGIGDSHAVKPKKELNLKTESNLTNYSLLGTNKSINQFNKNILTDSMFEKKFQIFVEKSLHIINDIRSLLEKGIDPPDGDEDISRRLLRVKEFSNRFSRNYLYPINRQLEELNKIKTPSSLTQKLLTAYQTVFNGLQAYLSHLPTSIGACSSEKLKLLLKQLMELLDIHDKVVRESEERNYGHLIMNFRLNTELTLEKIETHFTAISTESILKSNVTKTNLVQKKAKALKQKNRIEERLSMYNTTASFRKDALWKKAALGLSKKNNVKSRYKTSGFKHRPPTEPYEMQILPLPSKCKLFAKKSSMVLKETPHFPVANDDNIVTMVEIDDKSSNNEDENKKEEVNHEELVFRLLQLVLDNNRKKQNTYSTNNNEEKITDILNKLRNAVDPDMLQKIADGLQKNKHVNSESLAKLNILNQSEAIETTMKKRKEPKITITGAKNAKLICIKDENSATESENEGKKGGKNISNEIPIKCATSQTQTETNGKEKKNKTTQRPWSNMKRLPKSSTKLETLPKEFAVSIIQYKLDFHKFCKTNSMYRKTTSIVPWKLMAKLSDNLVDSALLTIAKEIKINEIAERIFLSELQL